MNILAIVGSPRRGKATDTLVDKAIDLGKKREPDVLIVANGLKSKSS